jgi:hypothetical protein
VDGTATSIGPGYLPIIGDQSYHFNRNLNANGGVDSRIKHKVEHYQKAIKACQKDDNPCEAAKQLGIALHPLQDFYAHGDYAIQDSTPNGGTWIHHNKHSPQTPLPGKPNLALYPDDTELDAVGGPSGRPAGAAMKMVTVSILKVKQQVDYAIYKRGTMRIRDTEAATRDVLTDYWTFLTGLPKSPCCKKYFGA